MNIEKLVHTAQKPKIYTPGTASMWVDEYISTQLLQIHLSQETELASRNKSTISSTIQWISQQVPGKGLKILDLGCGRGELLVMLREAGVEAMGIEGDAAVAQAGATGAGLAYGLAAIGLYGRHNLRVGMPHVVDPDTREKIDILFSVFIPYTTSFSTNKSNRIAAICAEHIFVSLVLDVCFLFCHESLS